MDTETCLLCIGVAGERTFQTIWEQAIADYGLQYMTAHHQIDIAKKQNIFSKHCRKNGQAKYNVYIWDK